ncbi:hypothetical protein FEM48_Zijuj04G0176800 [Ziziphus jujuba var. spinosa]|uniref:Uncharacterized protein n=1 Tax=Ziziphus jujuba var. spinosa TaxID=714518 RepID=A0A978VL93_ZIZJJ|nr:hypothetical protein FEM48_Zijuj04G0176800 [Ziziphus jujuba var. spinosa]
MISASIRVVTRPSSSSNSNGLFSAGNQDASIFKTVTDPDVLHCSICYEPSTISVFQVRYSPHSFLFFYFYFIFGPSLKLYGHFLIDLRFSFLVPMGF